MWLDYLIMAVGVALSLYAVLRAWLAYRAKRFRRFVTMASPLYGGDGCGGVSVICIDAIDMAQLENIVAPDNSGYEVILVMDGDSYDSYMHRIIHRYSLFEVALPHCCELPTNGIRHIWRNRFDALRRITLIDKISTSPEEDLDAGIALCTMEYVVHLPRHHYLDRGAADVMLSLVAEFEHRAECIVCGIDERIKLYHRDSLLHSGGFSGRGRRCSRARFKTRFVPVDIVSRISPARDNMYRISLLTIGCVAMLILNAVFDLSTESFTTLAIAVVSVVAARIYVSTSRISALLHAELHAPLKYGIKPRHIKHFF